MSMETETRSAPDLSLLSETFLCAKMKGTSTELPSADETRNRPNRAKIGAWRAIGVAGADMDGILELVGRSGREEKTVVPLVLCLLTMICQKNPYKTTSPVLSSSTPSSVSKSFISLSIRLL